MLGIIKSPSWIEYFDPSSAQPFCLPNSSLDDHKYPIVQGRHWKAHLPPYMGYPTIWICLRINPLFSNPLAIFVLTSLEQILFSPSHLHVVPKYCSLNKTSDFVLMCLKPWVLAPAWISTLIETYDFMYHKHPYSPWANIWQHPALRNIYPNQFTILFQKEKNNLQIFTKNIYLLQWVNGFWFPWSHLLSKYSFTVLRDHNYPFSVKDEFI